MTWLEQWRDLAARIDGLIRAGEFLASAINASETADVLGCVEQSILPERDAIIAEIKCLGDTYVSELPQPAYAALLKYVRWNNINNKTAGMIGIQSLASLAAFRSQFEYLIRDAEAEGRSLMELAFVHLQRQLEADAGIRNKWRAAFKNHELTCEKLGAVHLLSHGIWGFKVAASGAATDLVYPDPVEKYAGIMRRTTRALVLTEWKLVKSEKEIGKKAQEAREQAAIYSGGVLGDVELKRTRYIVLVCDKPDLMLPADVHDGAVTYRHVLLSTRSMAPSMKAKKLAGRRKSQGTV